MDKTRDYQQAILLAALGLFLSITCVLCSQIYHYASVHKQLLKQQEIAYYKNPKSELQI